ncbi:hypothetical protein RRF57_008259 [Xylaria bambusicola]|uniref:Uncharacterized protein n=1 Tax=Xylaria bambusicola TaxID=326684 RepID=A0AAN7UHE9_9PEZI
MYAISSGPNVFKTLGCDWYLFFKSQDQSPLILLLSAVIGLEGHKNEPAIRKETGGGPHDGSRQWGPAGEVDYLYWVAVCNVAQPLRQNT